MAIYEYNGRIYEEITSSKTWVAPANVTKVDVVCVGGGGGGGAAYWAGGGGGGGGLGWRKNVPVTPGQSYAVVVGAGGVGRAASAGGAGTSGGDSYFISLATVSGRGGSGGVGTSSNTNQSYDGGSGGSWSGQGGGSGGKGGNSTNDNAGGGGGAGGWSGNGGPANSGGSGGGGGGGANGGNNSSSGAAQSGGGVGVHASNWYSTVSGTLGMGGSGGGNGSPNGTVGGASNTGGRFGGGGGGQSNDSKSTPGCNGGPGVVVIAYEPVRVDFKNEEVSLSTIHKHDVAVTAILENATGSATKYRILVGSSQVYPASGWTEPRTGNYGISHVIPNGNFKLGSNTVRIEAEDDNGTYQSLGLVVTKVSAVPAVTWETPSSLHMEDATVTGTISDSDADDAVSYRIFVNDLLVFDWTEYSVSPVNFSSVIPNSYFTKDSSNTVKIEYRDDVNPSAVQQAMKQITLSNLLPNAMAVYPRIVHLENVEMNIAFDDPDGDKVRYKVTLNGALLSGWSAHRETPYNSQVLLPNLILIEGDNTVQVDIQDDYGGSASKTYIISKVNNSPSVAGLQVLGHTVIGLVNDVDGDRVQYRIMVNGEQLMPVEGFTDMLPPVRDIWFTIPKDKVKIGQTNSIEVEAVDHLGKSGVATLATQIGYAGLMFTDPSGAFYSTDIGEVLKYLDTGDTVAGNNSAIFEVHLKNTIGYDLNNIVLTVSQRELDGVTVRAEISAEAEPFMGMQLLEFPGVLSYGSRHVFHVRVMTTEQGYLGGLFDIYAEADTL